MQRNKVKTSFISRIAQKNSIPAGYFSPMLAKRERKTGYVYEEIYMWHNTGYLSSTKWVQPVEYWENPETKRRLDGLLSVCGLKDKLVMVRARLASREEITRFHTLDYLDMIIEKSTTTGGEAGDCAPIGKGSYEIASLSAGGVLSAVESVMNGTIENAYCLVRPPGHHAERDKGMGFCIFNNIVLGALHARTCSTKSGTKINQLAIIDYDVHHGNGTQQAFWNDPNCLFISLHQDNNYPQGLGCIEEIGGEGAKGTNINIPLPPGSGTGAYEYAFETVVMPAIRRFGPQFMFVSSGFDASFTDPLGNMMLTSEGFGRMTESLMIAADELCEGRLVFAHEGGYSKDYVPFCGVAVIEQLSGIESGVTDHYLTEARAMGYQTCQPHQRVLIDKVARLHNLSTAEEIQPIHQILSDLRATIPVLSDVEKEELKKKVLEIFN